MLPFFVHAKDGRMVGSVFALAGSLVLASPHSPQLCIPFLFEHSGCEVND
jgi:hypothetical protein